MKEPQISIGILFEPQIELTLLTPYIVNGSEVCGKQTVTYSNGSVLWQGTSYKELLFEPFDVNEGCFELLDVTIGINFHWERKEHQCFQGKFKVIVENHKLTGINILPVEAYLTSVISSEMSATASLELLKAHAVISRSWLLAQINKSKEVAKTLKPEEAPVETGKEIVRWYDREDHVAFDVCADDHCQRYQGITKASTQTVNQAIKETRGEVLTYGSEICDARFSKCCGGVFEEFQNCWENRKIPYLRKQRDSKTVTEIPDLTLEKEAEQWIRTSPEAFCHTTDKRVLAQVLNNYDQETTAFYRWKVEYTQNELSQLIKNRSGIDFGHIIDLIPVQRGTSGRLVKLKIVGDKRILIIGKELEIRRTLSASHLYSSAFVVDKYGDESGVPQKIMLTGAGWGHGVGLCQIGAAIMGEKGYRYDDILTHYYIDSEITKLY